MRHASAGSQSTASAASSSAPADTIAAIATAAAPAGLGVVRLSGPQSITIARRLSGIEPRPRHAHYVRFRDAAGEVIDDGLLIAFVAPASYTGEDVVELQAHGSPALLRLLLARCVELGARQARPGEFTERAFLNERLDLAQAEAVADLIHASSQAAARAARRALDGEFSRRVEALTEALTGLRIYVEAAIDFPEEEIDFLAGPELKSRLQLVRELMQALLREARRGQRLRDGLHVVIAGPPNAGKSSLLNALAGSERAIVTDIAGTTRDLLRESVLIDGIELTLVDTAGLREGADVVEAEGMRRARAEFQRADLALAVVECGFEQAQVPALREELAALPQVFWLHNKCELAAQPPRSESQPDGQHFWLSAREGAGLDALRDALKQAAGQGEAAEGAVSARARHVEALQRAHAQLESAAERLAEGSGELAAEDLRAAQEALGEITGRLSADDLLGRIFGSFCIGK
ncbi:MAG: tRNA uridine-5-carboxymethylaminomethyl(34) synthesis GTPase MnmE [Aquimonas sp.]|jgi:tRNA modification GTPase